MNRPALLHAPLSFTVSFALALAVLVAAPALFTPGAAAGRETVDAYGTWWFHWWVTHALTHGQSPLYTDLLFHPWGKNILTHTGGNLLDAALVIPVRLVAGPAVAWNVLVVAIVSTNALAAATWARRRGGDLSVALTVALLVGLHPFPLHELSEGRPTQAILAPVLIALAAGDEAFARGTTFAESDRRRLALAATALALAGWIYWYAAGFGALALCVLAIGRPVAPRVARLVVIGLGALLLTLPMVGPLATSLARGEVPGVLPIDRWLAGVADYTNAEGEIVRVSTLDRAGRAGFETNRGWVPEGPALGVATLLLAFAGTWRWRLVTLLGLAIAAGPFPGGHANPVYLALVQAFPPFERLYWPVRALGLLTVSGAVGATCLLTRVPTGARSWAAAALAAVLAMEAWTRGSLPIGSWTPTLPDAVRCVTADAPRDRAGAGGLVLPYGYDQAPLVWQTELGLPLFNGMAERSASLVPPEQREFRERNGWMSAVLYAPTDPREVRSWTPEEKAEVHALGYRWVVLRPAALAEPSSRASATGRRLRDAMRTLEGLLGPPIRVTDDAIVYAPWGGMDACRSPSSEVRSP